MHTGTGQVLELILEDGYRHARIACPSGLIPAPGQYLLAGDRSDASLPVPLFHRDSTSQRFIAAAPIPEWWDPGMELQLRGPLGNGFNLPGSARKVGLIALADSSARLRGLIRPALKQQAGVVMVGENSPADLPDDVEVHPMSALSDIVDWADYLAFDAPREKLHLLRERLSDLNRVMTGKEAQVLVYTSVLCGGVAECGVCAVILKSNWKMACKDGPVFDWREILE